MPNGVTGKSIRTKGFDRFQDRMNRFTRRFTNLTRVNRMVAVRLLSIIQRGFKAESVPGTKTKWAPLKPASIARKKKKGGSPLILQDKGLLRESFTIQGTNRRRIVVGTATIYARAHHQGFKKRNLPKRPILPSDSVARAEGLKVLNLAIKNLLGR